ncbi:hypothetical protein GCM10009734_58000 [Nonomuraea bangladeshensis]
MAYALCLWDRADDAMASLLEAETIAPEQVRHRYLSRQLKAVPLA